MTLLNTWLIRIFSVLWALFLFLDYASSSEYYTGAFSFFEYNGLLITSLIITAALAWLFAKKQQKGLVVQITGFRPVYSYAMVLLLMMLIMGFYVSVTDIKVGAGGSVLMFLFKTIGFHLAILPVVAAAFGAGFFIFSRIGIRLHPVSEFLVQLAIGFGALTLVLFLLGAVGLLTAWVVFPILGIFIWPGVKPGWMFIKSHLIAKAKPFELNTAAILPFVFVLFIMALNFTYTTRPFPIGFDDLSLYMNTPKLLAGYGALTQGGDAYNWSLVMSLGFVLYKSTPVAILLSILPGVLTLFVIYRIAANLKISKEWSLVACSIYYTMPNIIWQSRFDAKVDLALTFVTLCAVLLLIEYYFGKEKNAERVRIFNREWPALYIVWAVCGMLLGFAVGIKYTSMMVIFGFMVYLFYVTAGKWAAIGMFFLNFAVIFGLRLTRFAAFEAESVFLGVAPLIIAIGFFVFAFIRSRESLVRGMVLTTVFGLCIGLTFIPWAVKHISENGSVTFSHILTGKSPAPELYPEIKTGTVTGKNDQLFPAKSGASQSIAGFSLNTTSGIINGLLADATPSSAKSDTTNVKAGYTDKYEEIRRYLGYEDGVIRFISLPYDLAMKTNVKLWSADTGILFLMLLPIFLLAYRDKQLWQNVIKMLLMIVMLVVSIISVNSFAGAFDIGKTMETLSAAAFKEAPAFSFLAPLYIALKGLVLSTGNLLLPAYHFLTVQSLGFSFMLVMFSSILFYWLYSHTWRQESMAARSVLVITFTILMTWMILASGIFWYGMAGFTLLALCIGWFADRESNDKPFRNYMISAVVLLWFVLIIPFQFMPVRFTMAAKNESTDYRSFIDQPFASYALGASSEKDVFRKFFQPAEQGILNTINSNRNARVLNVATFLTYHINDNDRRVITDNQLGVFEKMFKASGGNKDELINEMKRKGIRYILVSLHTPSLDMTPEQSLRKKYSNLMNSMVNNPRVNLLYTNRVVERPDGQLMYMYQGAQVRAMNHLAGMRVLDQGTVALFEIP